MSHCGLLKSSIRFTHVIPGNRAVKNHWTSPLSRIVPLLVLSSTLVLSLPGVQAQTFDERMDDWPLKTKINGTIVACNSATIGPEPMNYFAIAAGRDKAVVLTIGLRDADIDAAENQWPEGSEVINWSWQDFIDAMTDDADAAIGTTENADQAVPELLDRASGIWLATPKNMNRTERESLRRLAPALQRLIDRGGALMTNDSATPMLGKYQVFGPQFLGNVNHATMGPGMNLIPDTVLQTNFSSQAGHRQLRSVLGSHPRCVGVGMDSDMTLILRGRKIRAMNGVASEKGQLHFQIMANERKPIRNKSIVALQGRRPNPYEFLVDLTAWRREAIDRTLPVFPATEMVTPNVENGTLMIIGGGGMPEGMMDQFIELAGGKDARLIYVPCLEREETGDRDQRLVNAWKQKGVASAHLIHTKDRTQANSDEEFLEPLKKATGIFFGGGRQWNFADSYYGTRAHRLMKEVLDRGGVIAGSSAGASIQGRYLARANPLGNIDIMAAGYERGGLGFLDGVAIDQHFTQRGRQKDMTELVNRYPQLLGIGLDETTAIVVRKSIAKVVGKGDVYFYDRNQQAAHDDPDYLKLGDGAKYDLAKRQVIDD